ncbi:hypothetical protein SLA2020_465740 [Shorea laevis]
MTTGKEKDGVSNKVLIHDDSLNAVNQNSNIMAARKEIEVNGVGAALENVLDSSGDRKDGSRQLSTGSPIPPSQSNKSFSPRHNSPVLDRRQLNQRETKPTCGERDKTGTSASPKKRINKRAFKESKSKEKRCLAMEKFRIGI